ncbi:MAG: hypothetical protein ACYDB9_04060 [Gammaproteobacteria bacterium]
MRHVAVLLLCLSPLAGCSVQPPPARTLEMMLPGSGVSGLALAANVGAVTITPSRDAGVHVTVALRPSQSFLGIISFGGQDAIKAATISHAVSDGVLKLAMQYPGNTHAGDVEEHWTVAVPPGLHINSHINVGKLQVSGITGGVEAALNVGKVVLDLPSGAMKVSANVGKIEARAHTLNYGNVTLNADVGDAQLKVNGASAGDREKAGAGSQVSYRGHGHDAIRLTVNTGKISLALGAN